MPSFGSKAVGTPSSFKASNQLSYLISRRSHGFGHDHLLDMVPVIFWVADLYRTAEAVHGSFELDGLLLTDVVIQWRVGFRLGHRQCRAAARICDTANIPS